MAMLKPHANKLENIEKQFALILTPENFITFSIKHFALGWDLSSIFISFFFFFMNKSCMDSMKANQTLLESED